MGTKIAPRGEKKVPELREILIRFSGTAQKVEDFLSRYKEAGYAARQVLMEKNLLNFEPCFRELMRDFYCAMRDLQILGRNSLEAQYVVRQMLPINHSSSIERVRYAMLRASQVAKRHLAAHPEKKMWKKPGWFLATAIIVAGYIHFYMVLDPAKRKQLLKKKYSGD